MPIIHRNIICDNPRNPKFGEEIEIRRYVFDGTNKPLGVLYGCFSPFTGLNGHGRLLLEAEKQGIQDFLVVSPNKKEKLDSDRNMFTLQQKVEITLRGCEDLGFRVLDAFIAKDNNLMATLTDIAERYENRRIVLLCGPDRIDMYRKVGLKPYDENFDALNKETSYEFVGVQDRGPMNVSGTKVRRTIREGNKEDFLRYTGYSEKMWDLCRSFAKENGTIEEKCSITEALESTKRQGIYHLYNPGNSMEFPQIKFLDLVEYLKDLGKLENGKNFTIQEKSDGAAFRMGIDDEGKFFIEQSYSGPIYDTDFIRAKYTQQSGRINRLGRGWYNIMKLLKSDKRTQSCLSRIYKQNGPFKIIGEIFISELGYADDEGTLTFVASRYNKERLGKSATIIMFDVLDGQGQPLEDSEDIIGYLIDEGSSADIKYDDANLVEEQNFVLDLKPVLKKIERNMENLEDEVGNIEQILSNPSRKRADQTVKKYVKGKVEEQQGLLNSAFEEQLEDYKGKWGPDYEGIVLKFRNGLNLKITSKKFKEFKASHDDTLQRWLKDEMDESFRNEFFFKMNRILKERS